MKKLKVLIPIAILLILVILFGLSFLRLPINILSKEMVEKETKGLITLNSLSNQTLKIMPKPILSIDNSNFKINYNLIQTDFAASDIEISRSIFNADDVSITLNQARIENINSNFVNNAILLEGDIDNLKLKISNEDNNTRIISNKFKYKGSDLYFDIYTTDSDINKINFSIENLEIDELVLLLGENYQEVLKKINFQSIDIKGEYIKQNLNIENLVITLADKSQINIEGNINLNNLINSDLSIKGQNISSSNLFQLIRNINFNEFIDIPQGIIEAFDLNYNSNNLTINKILYNSDQGTNLGLNGTIENLDFYNANFSASLTSSSKDDLSVLLKFLPYSELLKQLEFDEIKLSSNFANNIFTIDEINITNKDKNIVQISGNYGLDDINSLQLDIQLNQFKQFELIPSNSLIEFLKTLNTEYINMRGIINGSKLAVEDLQFINLEGSNLLIDGNLDLNNFNKASLNVGIENLNKTKLLNIISKFSEGDFTNIVDLVDFDYLETNLYVDPVSDLFLIENLELINKDKISNISGSIKNKMFTGSVELNDLNLSNLDRLFLNTSRIKGKIDLNLDVSEPINPKNIKNISGNIDGDINVNITEEEFALVLFIQSLSQDIEDFEQINELLNTLANSFINQSSSISGQISNNNLNEFKIKNLILTSPDGETLEAELELALNNFKITIFDIIDNEDFVIKYQNGNYSYERVIPDGTVKKPIEDLIQKNINKLFENLFQ